MKKKEKRKKKKKCGQAIVNFLVAVKKQNCLTTNKIDLNSWHGWRKIKFRIGSTKNLVKQNLAAQSAKELIHKLTSQFAGGQSTSALRETNRSLAKTLKKRTQEEMDERKLMEIIRLYLQPLPKGLGFPERRRIRSKWIEEAEKLFQQGRGKGMYTPIFLMTLKNRDSIFYIYNALIETIPEREEVMRWIDWSKLLKRGIDEITLKNYLEDEERKGYKFGPDSFDVLFVVLGDLKDIANNAFPGIMDKIFINSPDYLNKASNIILHYLSNNFQEVKRTAEDEVVSDQVIAFILDSPVLLYHLLNSFSEIINNEFPELILILIVENDKMIYTWNSDISLSTSESSKILLKKILENRKFNSVILKKFVKE